jgi:hypothetical protein
MKYLRYPLACLALLCLLGCPPSGPTQEQLASWRRSGPCADSMLIALSNKPTLTKAETDTLAKLRQRCDSWIQMNESQSRGYSSSTIWLLLSLPVFGVTLGLLLAFL